MVALADESKLFKELKEKLERDGDTRKNFFECIELASSYDKTERLFVLYRIKQLTANDTGVDAANAMIKLVKLLLNKNQEYGFYTAVIEASLD